MSYCVISLSKLRIQEMAWIPTSSPDVKIDKRLGNTTAKSRVKFQNEWRLGNIVVKSPNDQTTLLAYHAASWLRERLDKTSYRLVEYAEGFNVTFMINVYDHLSVGPSKR